MEERVISAEIPTLTNGPPYDVYLVWSDGHSNEKRATQTVDTGDR